MEEIGFVYLLKFFDLMVDLNFINGQLFYLFYIYWDGVLLVCCISVVVICLVDCYGEQFDLFNLFKYDMVKLEDIVDVICKCFGKMLIMWVFSLEKGGMFIERSQLVGGYVGG